jgi:hypothetical protein
MLISDTAGMSCLKINEVGWEGVEWTTLALGSFQLRSRCRLALILVT